MFLNTPQDEEIKYLNILSK